MDAWILKLLYNIFIGAIKIIIIAILSVEMLIIFITPGYIQNQWVVQIPLLLSIIPIYMLAYRAKLPE
jgi:hypothetical protein